MPGEVFAGPFSRKFEIDFLHRVALDRSRDPSQPVVILVGSNLLAAHLRHALALHTGGHANIRFVTFVDLAAAFLRKSHPQSERTPFPKGAEELLLSRRAALLPSDSIFSSVSAQPGFAQALKRSLHDLLDAGVSELPPRDRKFSELSRLFSEFRKSYLSRYFTTADLLAEASDSADLPGTFGTESLYLYGFYDFTEVQRRLLAACAKRAKLLAWVPLPPPEERIPRATVGFLASLGLVPRELATDVPLAATLAFSSADPHMEAEDAVREILDRLEERALPLSEVGILLRSPDRYAASFSEVLERAGLPHYLEGGRSRLETPLGRTLLRVAGGTSSHGRRREILSILSEFPFPSEFFERAGTPPDWDSWTRAALVTSFHSASSLRRLKRWEEHLSRRGESSARKLSFFLRFLEPFLRALDEVRNSGGNFLAFSRAVESLFREHSSDPSTPDVLASLASYFRALEEAGISPSPREMEQATQDHLSELRIDETVFGRDGVFVGSVASARSIPFEILVVPGLSERSFPLPPQQDPLLLDRERAWINSSMGASLSLQERRLEEERLSFSLLRRQATKLLVCSHPRTEGASARPLAPSTFFLEIVDPKSAEVRQALPWEGTRTRYLDRQDWFASRVTALVRNDRTGMLSILRATSPLADSVDAWVRNRFGSNHWTEHDGRIGPVGVFRPSSKPFSATELTTYLTCPYRYFLGEVLRLHAEEDPEEVVRIRPFDRGTLLHAILFRFYTTLRDQKALPIKREEQDKARALLQEIAREELDRAEKELALGPPAIWKIEKEILRADLASFLEEELAEETPFIPADFEIRFGPGTQSAAEGKLSRDEAVEVDTGNGKVLLQGRIDRLDLTADRKRALIVDYKTGRLDEDKPNAFSAGRALQLPIYLSALTHLVPSVDLELSKAALYSTTSTGDFVRVEFDGALFNARRAEFHTLLSTAVNGIREGIFSPNPGKDGKNCRVCDFRSLCGYAVRPLYERKVDDPATEPLRKLEEIL